MMKKKKSIIIIIISILLVIGIAIGLYFILNDKDKLTVSERNWVNESIGTIQNINVVNNVNVFGKDGSGVYYDFIKDFETEYGLNINPITFNEGSNPSGITFGVKQSISENDILFYTDHYVLVSKNNDIISQEENLNGKSIDILSKDLSPKFLVSFIISSPYLDIILFSSTSGTISEIVPTATISKYFK